MIRSTKNMYFWNLTQSLSNTQLCTVVNAFRVFHPESMVKFNGQCNSSKRRDVLVYKHHEGATVTNRFTATVLCLRFFSIPRSPSYLLGSP